ncbi:MAG TPA: TetR family transcriptional regulator [Acidimicrobiia bacterium]|nr:TetR family transcriptional regulator [Acidimicrobiia bacterium]
MARATTDVDARAENRAPDPDTLPAHLRDRRDRIVRAALDLLEHGEYDTVQMREVAEHADVALGTLYRYFTSKEHLYAAALLEWASGFRSRRGGDGAAQPDAQRLRALLHRAVRAFERRPQLLRAEMVLQSSNDPNARALFQQFADRHLAAMTDALPGLPPEQAAAVVETTNSVMDARLRSWALGRCSIRDVLAAVDRTVDLIFSPAPGPR